MLWNSVGSLCNLGCQWLISVLIVRLSSGYDAAGTYSLAVAVYNIFGSIAQYRMYTYQVSDVTDENTTGEYLSFRIITATVALALCIGYGILTCNFSAWGAIFFYAIYKTATLVIDVFHACDQRFHRMDYIGISLSLQGILSLGSFVATFVMTTSLEIALMSMTVVVSLVGALYDYPKTKALSPIKVGISRKKVRKLLLGCLSIVLAGMAASATVSLPRQALSDCMGSGVLGAYASVAAPVAIIQMGAAYIYNPLLGYFSERYHESDMRGFIRLLLKSTFAIAGVGLICVIGLALLGEPILVFVFGDSIKPYIYLLVPLVVFAIMTGVQWFLNDLLIAIREFGATFTSSALSFVIAVAAMYPLINRFGPMGVTIDGMLACVASYVVMGARLFSVLRNSLLGHR